MKEEYFVLDCSITMSWCFENELDNYSLNVLDSLSKHKALVPLIWSLEVTNALAVSERRKLISIADSIRFLELLDNSPIFLSDLTFTNSEILSTARANHLTSYDALYLLLAIKTGCSIASKDKLLINASANNGVPLYLGSLD